MIWMIFIMHQYYSQDIRKNRVSMLKGNVIDSIGKYALKSANVTIANQQTAIPLSFAQTNSYGEFTIHSHSKLSFGFICVKDIFLRNAEINL